MSVKQRTVMRSRGKLKELRANTAHTQVPGTEAAIPQKRSLPMYIFASRQMPIKVKLCLCLTNNVLHREHVWETNL
jgi:hypothetical protein